MVNLLMAVLGLFSGFPKPDIVAVDYGSVQAGVGYAWNFSDVDKMGLFMRPDFGLSLGQLRCYWGKKLAFAAGLELFRMERGFSSAQGRHYYFLFSELLMPQVGVSYILGPSRARLFNGGLEFGDSYVPRLDLVCGFSPVDITFIRNQTFSPTLRIEAKLILNRTFQVLLENRNMLAPGEKCNTLHLSLAFALGRDIIKPEEGIPE